MTRRQFAGMLLKEMGVPDTDAHVGARRFLVAWMHAETGEHPGLCNGVSGEGAAWNPLNTTLKMPGSTFYNHLSTTTGVQNYATAKDGTVAFRRTLEGDTRYAELVSLFKTPGSTQADLATALDKSPWGTHKPLITVAIEAYNHDRKFFNRYPIGP